MNITYPAVHLNGSGRQNLMEQYDAMISTLKAAVRAFERNGPHGRDYYVLPAGSFEKAAAEHLARLAKLDEVLAEVTELALSVRQVR